MAERVVLGVVYPAYFGKGLYGDVFDRPLPEQTVYKQKKRQKPMRLPGGKVKRRG